MKHFACICIPFLLVVNLHAQTPNRDSLNAVDQAKADAENFLLNKADLKQFRKHRAAYMSGYNNTPKLFPGNPFPRVPMLSNPADPRRVRYDYNKVDYLADYFKPSKATTKDTSLLKDSIYVKAYRDAAYAKTTKRHPTIFYLGIGAAVAGAVVLTVIILQLAATEG